MKLLAFTDTHSQMKLLDKALSKAKKHSPDIIVCAGDIADYERDLEIMIRKLKQTKILTFIIQGNHESIEKMQKLCTGNVIFLHKRTYTIGSYTFFGYGGGGFNQEDKKLESLIPKVKQASKENLIFITHMPPHNTKLDYLPISKGHAGSLSAARLIKALKPMLVITGHLHENFYKKDSLGSSYLINPGPEGAILEF